MTIRIDRPKFGIVPGIEAHDIGGRVELFADHYSPRQGIYFFGYAHECEAATLDAGKPRYHAVVEFHDVRDINAPFLISVLHPHSDLDDEHYNLKGAEGKVLEIINDFAEEADDPDLEVGDLLKAIIRADARVEYERAQAVRQAIGGLLGKIFGGRADVDDDSDPLPGLFGKANLIQ